MAFEVNQSTFFYNFFSVTRPKELKWQDMNSHLLLYSLKNIYVLYTLTFCSLAGRLKVRTYFLLALKKNA